MSSPSELGPRKPAAPPPQSADDVLPPVEAPGAGFILQLFLIPMVIVVIIVMIWLMFSWLAHLGSDPKDLVRDLRSLNDASWQKAYTLSNLLRNPEFDHLKDDAELAGELSGVLEAQLAEGRTDENRLKLQMFVCRALGEFRVADGLPILLEAAAAGENADLDVRRTALEAIAVLAGNVGPQSLRSDATLLATLRQASQERDEGQPAGKRGDLRSTAAFTLGVIGGPEAIDTLAVMLNDPYANVRYNAATGLARYGDSRAVPVLVEMLDPDNETAVADEVGEAARQSKRLSVLGSAISSAIRFHQANPEADFAPLEAGLRNLQSGDLPRPVRLAATEALDVVSNSPAKVPQP